MTQHMLCILLGQGHETLSLAGSLCSGSHIPLRDIAGYHHIRETLQTYNPTHPHPKTHSTEPEEAKTGAHQHTWI